VSHDEVKGMVHILMEQNEDFHGMFNGKFVEYVPMVQAVEDDDVLDDDELLALDEDADKEAESLVKQMRLKVTTGPAGSFVDRDVLLFPGEVASLRFDHPVSVVEIRAG
jgi:hypothetical protein